MSKIYNVKTNNGNAIYIANSIADIDKFLVTKKLKPISIECGIAIELVFLSTIRSATIYTTKYPSKKPNGCANRDEYLLPEWRRIYIHNIDVLKLYVSKTYFGKYDHLLLKYGYNGTGEKISSLFYTMSDIKDFLIENAISVNDVDIASLFTTQKK